MENFHPWIRYGLWNYPFAYSAFAPQYPIWNYSRQTDFYPTAKVTEYDYFDTRSSFTGGYPSAAYRSPCAVSPEEWNVEAEDHFPQAETNRVLSESFQSNEYPGCYSPVKLIIDEDARSTPPAPPAAECVSSTVQQIPIKKKRARTAFSGRQLAILEEEFGKNQYVNGAARVGLAARLNLTESQVKVWWQNRRIKQRRLSAGKKASPGENDRFLDFTHSGSQYVQLPPCSTLHKPGQGDCAFN